MKLIKIKSKQPGITVSKLVPKFKYYFGSKPVEMSEKHAKEILKNPNFEMVGKPKEKEVDMDLNDDGVVDNKDASIAGKVLANSRKKKKEMIKNDISTTE